MKYAVIAIAFVLPVAFGVTGDTLTWYNLIMGVVMWIMSVYSFCKEDC